jgi:hypothetical protein
MELIIGFVLAVLGIVAPAVSRLLADEFKAWTPWIIRHLIKHAVRQLREAQRERFEEEWAAHIFETPGEVGKLIAALGFLRASGRMSLELTVTKRAVDVLASAITLLIVAPRLAAAAVLIKSEDSGSILVRRDVKGMNGRTVSLFKFRTVAVSGRRTRVGSLLQWTSLDALPILINCLRGDLHFLSWKRVI